jgi:hypothetical protein
LGLDVTPGIVLHRHCCQLLVGCKRFVDVFYDEEEEK